MLAVERVLEIRETVGEDVQRIVPLELDGEALRLILYLKNGTNLRVTEQWQGDMLKRYSYYWLTSANKLKIGWDNAPHHAKMDSFPHHKHVSRQDNIVSSNETCLEDVMEFILAKLGH